MKTTPFATAGEVRKTALPLNPTAQIFAPVVAFNAITYPFAKPEYTTPPTTAGDPSPSANPWTQTFLPVVALTAHRLPFCDVTYTMPPATAGDVRTAEAAAKDQFVAPVDV